MILGIVDVRAPGLAMKPILGMPMIGRQLERLARCESLDRIVVAMTMARSDDALAGFVERQGVRVFRGSSLDPLGRLQGAAIASGPATHVVRIGADCPLIDPAVVDACVWLHVEKGADYTSNTLERTYPQGLEAEAASAAMLKAAFREARGGERERLDAFAAGRGDRFRLAQLTQAARLGDRRWQAETPDDFEFVSRVFYMLYPIRPAFEQADVLGLSIERQAA